jgi:hypothetical protein
MNILHVPTFFSRAERQHISYEYTSQRSGFMHVSMRTKGCRISKPT